MLLPSIIGEFVEPISTCQLNWPVFKLKEKVELRVEKIMLLLNELILMGFMGLIIFDFILRILNTRSDEAKPVWICAFTAPNFFAGWSIANK